MSDCPRWPRFAVVLLFAFTFLLLPKSNTLSHGDPPLPPLYRDATPPQGIFDNEKVILTSHAPAAAAERYTIRTVSAPKVKPSQLMLADTTKTPAAPDLQSPLKIGLKVGGVQDTTVGFANNPCNVSLSLSFDLLNATTDNSSGNLIVPSAQADADSGGVLSPLRHDVNTAGGGTGSAGPGSSISPANGLPAHVDRYPSYLNTLFEGLAPEARFSGSQMIGGEAWVMEVLVFQAGSLAALPPPHPLRDLGVAALGYVEVTVLNDPANPASPGGVTNSCTPFSMERTTYAFAKSNPCQFNTAPPCNTDGGINSPASGADTADVVDRNPDSPGTYLYYMFSQTVRDLDNDGLENDFDTCPYTANIDGDPRVSAGPDGDMIDSACDPTPGSDTGDGNHDFDTAPNGSPWLNAGDNCPLIANSTNAEAELSEPLNAGAPRGGPPRDDIGDACDTAESGIQCDNSVDDDADGLVNDGCPANGSAEVGCLNSADDDADGKVNDGCPSSARVANGHFHTSLGVTAVCIGATDWDSDGWCSTATGSLPADPNDGNANVTPETYSMFLPLPITHSGSGLYPPQREPIQVCNDGVDNDGDGSIDLLDAGCKPVITGTSDSDGDGYSDEAEIHIGTDALGRCEKGGPSTSTDWPPDLTDAGSFSRDKVNISDLSAFVGVPRPYGASPGNQSYDRRYDLVPGPGALPGAWINILDLQSLAFGTAPMFGGARVFSGPPCSANPTLND